MMTAGQIKHLSEITFNGSVYHVCVKCAADGDPAMIYFLMLIKGDWQAAQPEIISAPLLDDTFGNQEKYPEPKDYVNWAVNLLQTEWKKIEGDTPPPIPVTWTEKLEAYLLKVAFFRNADGTHTIKIVE